MTWFKSNWMDVYQSVQILLLALQYHGLIRPLENASQRSPCFVRRQKVSRNRSRKQTSTKTIMVLKMQNSRTKQQVQVIEYCCRPFPITSEAREEQSTSVLFPSDVLFSERHTMRWETDSQRTKWASVLSKVCSESGAHQRCTEGCGKYKSFVQKQKEHAKSALLFIDQESLSPDGDKKGQRSRI